MSKLIHKVNETGTLLVEALAMLGLIAMVTPILYKKAAERTTELQDINASGQLRIYSDAMDGYIKDNFARIDEGRKVSDQCGANSEVDFKDFDRDNNNRDDNIVTFSASHLCEYLPYGALDNNNNLRDSKLFNANDNFNVVIKVNTKRNVDSGEIENTTITGFLVAVPADGADFPPSRTARIATMVGSNGGYVEEGDAGNVILGSQGAWRIDDLADLGLDDTTAPRNTFVVSSLEPISAGMVNEDVLFRVHKRNDTDYHLNRMTTDLIMGNRKDTTGRNYNIRNVNQIILHPDANSMVGSDGDVISNVLNDVPYGGAPTVDQALYIQNGGAYMEGNLHALNGGFIVTDGGNGAGAGAGGAGEPDMRGVYFRSATDDEGNSQEIFRLTENALEYSNGNDSVAYHMGIEPHGEFTMQKRNRASSTGGQTALPNNIISANPERVSLMGWTDNARALNIFPTLTQNDQVYSGAKVVVGGDQRQVMSGSYKRYDGINAGGIDANGDFALSVMGPAYVKDTLLTPNLRTRDIDVATLNAGLPTENWRGNNNPMNYFMNVSASQGAGADEIEGRFRVGPEGPGKTPFLSVVGGIQRDAGIALNHDSGIQIRSGFQANDLNIRDETVDIIAPTINLAVGEQVLPSGRPVQNNVLSVYNDSDNYMMDTRVDQLRIGSRDDDLDHIEKRDNSSVVGLVNTDFSIVNSVGEPIVDIIAEKGDNTVSSRFMGGFEIYDHDEEPDAQLGRPGQQNDHVVAALAVKKGDFRIQATENFNGVARRDIIFQVDSNNNITDTDNSLQDPPMGSVYIRKGAISLETSDPVNRKRLRPDIIEQDYNTDGNTIFPQGYIAAERFISQVELAPEAVPFDENRTEVTQGTSMVHYDRYEVNPAYTSVMHDIKLTTRGGARLSDILPDFINKGIYVVDNTYKESTKWQSKNPTSLDAIGTTNQVSGGNMSAYTSPYLGYVPTPTCPPGYAKVITINPSGWSMAQAGTPFTKDGFIDIRPHNNPYLYWYNADGHRRSDRPTGSLGLNTKNTLKGGPTKLPDPTPGVVEPTLPVQEDDPIPPLTFQKSTWLKAMVVPACPSLSNNNNDACEPNRFIGWGAFMGFLYPEAYYRDFINFGKDEGKNNKKTDRLTENSNVYWNLFPVRYRELEAYATVYCYFDRSSRNFDGKYVDTSYNQLLPSKRRHHSSKVPSKSVLRNTPYMQRLNDPSLNYNDPW